MFQRIRYQLLRNVRNYYVVNSNLSNIKEDLVAKQIYSRIKATGPITIADYMKEVLVNPMGGYYMHKDVFGTGGDFITSPELGQVFGEMIAIWFLNEWSKIGSPKPLQIVELGPGRGTLMQDLLRVFKHFDALNQVSVHLVEVSPLLCDLQSKRLCIQSKTIADQNCDFYRDGISFEGNPIKWYKHLSQVPQGFTIILAHEFFDVLPIHKFQKTDQGYREILVDINPDKDLNFRYIIARENTPATKLFIDKDENREHFEVSPESLVLIKDIAIRLERDGGLALIADYGHNGDKTDTFRAFKKHKLHDPLIEPGTADLTADVDFKLLKRAATEDGRLIGFGPVTQRDFLFKMGIEHRIKKLDSTLTDEEHRKILKSSFEMMTDNDKMGARFKFLALLPAVLEKILNKVPVVGFH